MWIWVFVCYFVYIYVCLLSCYSKSVVSVWWMWRYQRRETQGLWVPVTQCNLLRVWSILPVLTLPITLSPCKILTRFATLFSHTITRQQYSTNRGHRIHHICLRTHTQKHARARLSFVVFIWHCFLPKGENMFSARILPTIIIIITCRSNHFPLFGQPQQILNYHRAVTHK